MKTTDMQISEFGRISAKWVIYEKSLKVCTPSILQITSNLLNCSFISTDGAGKQHFTMYPNEYSGR